MYYGLALFVGIVITIMNAINSRFAAGVGSLASTLVIHVVGLLAVSIVCLVSRERTGPGRIPFYYYLGGVVGVGTVFSCNYAFAALGASLAVALALLGQALFSLFADATGFLGRKRYPLSARSVPGIALVAAGCAVMAGSWNATAPALVAGLLGGILPGLSFILNSELGVKKGVLRSARFNYLTGLATTALILVVLRQPLGPAARSLGRTNPFLMCGGLLGVFMVVAMNFVFPRIPAFSATLLLFAGEALAGLVVDAVSLGVLDPRNLAATCLVVAGLAVNTALGRRSSAGSGQATGNKA